MSLRPFLHYVPQLAASAWVDDSAVVIGRVWLGERVSVWPGAVIRGDVNTICIGEESNIQDLACLHVVNEDGPMQGGPLTLGARVTVGHQAMLHGCTIGDECLIGMGALVLDRAVVPPRTMIGAGALVPPDKVLESGWLYVGCPAKPLRRLSEEESAYLTHSAQHYARLMEKYRTAP